MAYAAGWGPVEGRDGVWRVWVGGWFSAKQLDAARDTGAFFAGISSLLDDVIREQGWRLIGEPIIQRHRPAEPRTLAERDLQYWRAVADAAASMC